MTADNVVKIADFGLAREIEPNERNYPNIGSLFYRAPELILCVSQYTNAIDVWGKHHSKVVKQLVLFEKRRDAFWSKCTKEAPFLKGNRMRI